MTAGVRQATIRRNTAETKIALTVNLDGTGASEIATGVRAANFSCRSLALSSCNSSTAKIFSATVSLRKMDASCGR
jgi:imidazoleglycerol phosphate dehydratase HisB